MIAALRYFVSEAALGLWRGRRSSALSILTIGVALFMLGLFLVVTTNLEALVGEWGRSAEFSVYLRDDVQPDQQAGIQRMLRAEKAVAGVDFVSRDAALGRFRRDFPDLAPATRDGTNPFPASFEARLSPGVPSSTLQRFADTLARVPGVADVRYDRRWLDRLASLTSFVRWAGLSLAAVLVLAAALTVTGVVRLALYARRDEIEIMELVGAPLSFIRGPFVVEGVLQGGAGAALALVALHAGLALTRARLAAAAAGLVDVSAVRGLPAATALLLLAGGMAVGCLGGIVAARGLR